MVQEPALLLSGKKQAFFSTDLGPVTCLWSVCIAPVYINCTVSNVFEVAAVEKPDRVKYYIGSSNTASGDQAESLIPCILKMSHFQ